MHVEKGSVGRVAPPSSRTHCVPCLALGLLNGSGHVQACLTATVLSVCVSEEQFILSQVALLEQVEALVPMLDSAHIKAVPEHAARLQRLAQIHIQQQDQCVEITEESKALLEEYNKTTMLLSKQFVQWDELLCQLEAAKQVKPAEE